MSLYDDEGQEYRKIDKKSQVPKRRKTRRVEGDYLWYFILHNLYSSVFFALIGTILGIFSQQFLILTEIFSLLFLEVLFSVIVLMIVTGLIGRIAAYFTLKIIYRWRDAGAMKTIGEYNKGINKMTSISYFIAISLSSLVFTLGIFPIIESRLFGESTTFTVVLTYLFIKIAIFLIVSLFSGFKL
jgi:hypothetical protein